MQLVPSDGSSGRDPTDTDLVAMLRGSDPDARRKALDALFPLTSAALIVVTPTMTHYTVGSHVKVANLFGALLYLVQRVGQGLGLVLGWVPDPEQQNRLVVPTHLPENLG